MSFEQKPWFHDELARVWLLAELAVRRHLEAGGLRKRTRDLAAIRAARATHCSSPDLAILAAACARATHDVHTRRPATPLGILTRRLDLTVLDTEVLIIALAPHVDPTLADLFHLLRGEVQRGLTLALVGQLLRFGRAAQARLLGTIDHGGALVRRRLIEVGPATVHDASNRIIHPTCDAIDLLRESVPSGPLRANA